MPAIAGGDFHPTVATAIGLMERGHEVLVYAEHDGVKALLETDLATYTAPRELDFRRRLISQHDPDRKAGGKEGPLALQQTLDEYSADQAAELKRSVLAEFQPDVFVASLTASAVADKLSNPADLATCVVNSDFYGGPNPPRPLEEDYDDRVIPEFVYMGEAMQRADLVLHAVDQHFDYDFTKLPAHNHYVGPLQWERPGRRPYYLDEPGNPWALVSISSLKQGDVAVARYAIEAFQHLPLRMVETIGHGHTRKEIGGVPANIHVEYYVPHSQVLEQAAVCVTHCGIGSVHKALWYGVPLVMVPWGRDQPGVANRAARLGVGIIVRPDRLSEESLESAVREVLDRPSYAEAAASVSKQYRSMDPVGKACDLIESTFS